MKGDVIELKFPAKPDYILAVRLAVSAIAERAGFGIDDIEDLKVASAEACILLLSSGPERMDIRVTVDDGLAIEVRAAGKRTEAQGGEESGELSQYLLEALVDKCELDEQDGVLAGVTIRKKR